MTAAETKRLSVRRVLAYAALGATALGATAAVSAGTAVWMVSRAAPPSAAPFEAELRGVFGADPGAMASASALLHGLRGGGMALTHIGDDHGLSGWVGIKGDAPTLLYLAPDGKAMVVGALLGADGTPVTTRQVEAAGRAGAFGPTGAAEAAVPMAGAAAPAQQPVTARPVVPQAAPVVPQAALAAPGGEFRPGDAAEAKAAGPRQDPDGRADEVLARLETGTTWVRLGSPDAPVAWVLFDFNCSYCQRLWGDLLPLVDAGRIQVRAVPVAILNDTSAGYATAMLESPDPAAALAAHERGTARLVPKTPDTADKAAIAAVLQNTEFMRAQGIVGTPYTAFRAADGKAVGIVGGFRDVRGTLAPLLGG